MPPSLYRPCVGAVLLNAAGQVFIGERRKIKGAWQMPQGGIDRGETPATAVLRELQEEVGTNKAEILAESASWHRYDLPLEIATKSWNGRWKGQEQKWFALGFSGQDQDINIATAEPEFQSWCWANAEDVITLVVGFKRPIYAAVLNEFRPIIAARQNKTGGICAGQSGTASKQN